VFDALFYLTFTSLGNSVRQRLRRLRQPKYLFGALAGAAYFYFFVFGFAFRRNGGPGISGLGAPAGGPEAFVPLGAAVLFLLVLLGWIFGRDRAALQFTEAETAFLFPAPLSRRGLLQYKLLRSQLGILFGALVLSFLFRRGATLGGSTLMHALGWWLILSTLNLHYIASSFARERLLDFGLTRWRRAALLVAGLALAGGAWWLAGRQEEAARALKVLYDRGEYLTWLDRLLELPPLGWLLVPFGWLVRPFLAPSWMDFLLVLGPALLLLGAHYLWVMRSAVAFEEASVELAAKTARTMAAMRSGRLHSRTPSKPRPAPWSLGARGWAPLAFLWKSLITLGPFYRLRTWLIGAAVIVGVTTWLRQVPAYETYLKVLGFSAVMLGGYLLLFAPIFMRRNITVIIDQMEMTKSYPLPGWQIIAGELLTPGVVVTFIEWLFLLTAFLASSTIHGRNPFAGLLVGGFGAAAGIALLAPPLIALMMCIPLAMMLYFPAWSKPTPGQAGGIENMGQGIISLIGFILVLLVTLLPAAAVGAVAYIIINWLLGAAAAVTTALLVASGLLVFELAAIIWWLGEKLDRFDLSREAAR
jgi:hypothetical protein